MPRRIDEIDDKHDSIVRPVAMAIARQVAKTLKLPPNINILYPGEWGEGINTGATINTPPTADPARFKYSDRFKIEVTESAVEDRVMAIAAHRADMLPVFNDHALGIVITPIVVATAMELSITFRAESRPEAIKFRDDIRARFAEGRTDYIHEIDYHWNIPDPQILLLKDLFKLRESVAGYGDTLEDYISANISKRATNIATLIGTESKIAIREMQIAPQGFFDFAGAPDKEEKDREGATMNVTFRYTFTYDQVIGTAVQYPLMIHGQLIQDNWYYHPNASGTQPIPNRRPQFASVSRSNFAAIAEMGPDLERLQYQPVKVPYFDDWSPTYVKPQTSLFIQGAVGVNPETPTILFGIDDFDFEIDPLLVAFLKQERHWATKIKESIFHCALFEGYSPMNDSVLWLDSELRFRTTQPLDPRKLYHIQIRFVHTLASLTPDARLRLRQAGKAGLMVLEWLQFLRRGFAYIPTPDKLIRGEYITDPDLSIIEEILDRRIPERNHLGRKTGVMKTAGQFTIVAKRRPK